MKQHFETLNSALLKATGLTGLEHEQAKVALQTLYKGMGELAASYEKAVEELKAAREATASPVKELPAAE